MGTPIQPVFIGHVSSTEDALLLFEACFLGILQPLTRRPLDRERPDLIKSGAVFIYSERTSNIKRWTDGLIWSPSRSLTNFLIYRELDDQVCQDPNQKKQIKRSKKLKSSRSPEASHSTSFREDLEKSLIGSLIDSYEFKKDGLVKKTISVKVHGVAHHLVSYYNVQEAMDQKLTTPSMDSRLKDIVIRDELLGQEFSVSLMDEAALPNLYTVYHPFPMITYPESQSTYEHQPRSTQCQQILPNYPIMNTSHSVQMPPLPWSQSENYHLQASTESTYPPSSLPPYSSAWSAASYTQLDQGGMYITSGSPGKITTSIDPYSPSLTQHTWGQAPSACFQTQSYPHSQPLHSRHNSETGSASWLGTSSPEAQLSPSSTHSFASPSLPSAFDPDASEFQYFQRGAFR